MIEIKVNVSKEKIVRSSVETCVLIEASKLSLEDKFMQHEPKTKNAKELKALLKEVITCGIKDFWRPRLDPSFDNDENGIRYVAGNKPAVGRSCTWWETKAKAYNPKCISRLGTRLEYVAFLGVLIKALISEGWDVADAWNAVCNDSQKLGHYRDSENAKHDFEPTGSREICGFYDLANTYKLLADDKEAASFWVAGGDCFNYSYYIPLADFVRNNGQDCDNYRGVGWLVLEEGTTDN